MNTELEKAAIKRLQMFDKGPEKPYCVCYSGGKDSDCIRILADLAGVPHTVEHNLTTVDAPETVRYVKSVPGVIINRPKETMWQLIERMGVPTRIQRFCCEALKETKAHGRIKVTGVRWAESVNRKKNRGLVNISGKPKAVQTVTEKEGADYFVSKSGTITMNMDNSATRRTVESCYRTSTVLLNPIIDWQDADVWEFLGHYGCKSNPLYSEGCRRIGCIGCPMKGSAGMKADFARYPTYRRAYVRAFDKMLKHRVELGKTITGYWKGGTGEDVMKWWIGEDPDQIGMEWEEGENA